MKRPANCYLISPDDGSFNIPVFGQIDRAKADGGLSGIWADNNTKLAAEVLCTVQTGHGTFETLQREARYSGEENAAA